MSDKQYIGIKEAMDRLEVTMPIRSRVDINRMCIQEVISARRDKSNNWEIPEEYVTEQINWAQGKINIGKWIKDKVITEYKGDDEKNLSRKIKELIKPHIIDVKETIFVYPTIMENDLATVETIINDEIQKRNKLFSMVKLSDASEQLGRSEFVIKGLIHAEKIKAESVNGAWLIDQEELDRYREKTNRVIGLYDFYKERLYDTPTAFDIENEHDRLMLNRFVLTHDKLGFVANKIWADIRSDKRNQIYFLSEYAPLFEAIIKKWLVGYGVIEKKTDIINKHYYWNTHPRTKRIFLDFKKTVTPNISTNVSEVIVNSLEVEITNTTMDDIYTMLDYASSDGRKKIYVESVKKFVYFVKNNYETQWDFASIDIQRDKYVTYNSSTAPYTQEQYAKLGILTFNQEVVEKLGLIDKGIKNPRFAFLWLWIAWHYLGAWRRGDLKQIPVYKNINKKEIPQIIMAENHEKYTDIITLWLENEINNSELLPFKTAERQKHHYLRVSFAESLREIIGIIYLLVIYHTTAEDRLDDMPEEFKVGEFQEFFGPEYTAIFSKMPLSNRRLNKNFLDYIAQDVETNQTLDRKVLGYMVASFGRAHVQGDRLSDTTSVYLTHQLDGLSGNEISKLLFEEGAFSFVSQYMLKAIYGDGYDKLPIDKQSLIIQKVKDSPALLEKISSMCIKSANDAKILVDKMFSGDKRLMNDAIKAILNHSAKGKDVGVDCLMLARGGGCVNSKRKTCFGCKCAILETHAILQLYQKLQETLHDYNVATTIVEKEKNKMEINTYMNGLSELLYVAHTVYELDVTEIETTVESILGGENYVGNCK